MRPERLISSLCAAQGIDMRMLSRATGERWTVADVGLACGPYRDRRGKIVRLEQRAELAFRYRWAREEGARGQLKGYLMIAAVDLKEAEEWPSTVKRVDAATGEVRDDRYLEDLVELALLEEHHWFVLRQYQLWSRVMRVPPYVWRRSLERKYEALRYRLECWCGDAHAHLRRKLRGDRGAEAS